MIDPIVWYVHGANSTPLCFRYIKSRLQPHDFVDVTYDHDRSVSRVVDSLIEKADASSRPIYIVGHSLGGVIAAAVSQRAKNVEKVATISSPFGGSRIAGLLRWLCPHQLFEDIHPRSALMHSVLQTRLRCPVMSIVTTAGCNPFISEENDGVVTVESQRALLGPTYINIGASHFEILLTSEVIDLISGFFFS